MNKLKNILLFICLFGVVAWAIDSVAPYNDFAPIAALFLTILISYVWSKINRKYLTDNE